MQKKLFLALLVLVLIALPLLTACGEEAVTTTPPTTTPPTTTPPPSSINITYPGGFMGGLTSVDPCDFFGAPPPGIFETLVGFDGNEQMIGLLAESWTFLDGGLTLEFKLKEDIVFSSGDPLTAADVEFSLNRHKEKDMPIIAQLSPEQGYSGMEVVGDYTVRFYFTKVNVQFLPQTCVNMGITSKAYYDRVGEDGYIAMPVGTGPYKIVEWAEGQYIDLAYNETWRGEKPQILTAHFLVSTDSATRVAMLQAGEVDMATQVPGASIASLEDAGFARVNVPQPHDIVLVFDLLTPDTPWSKLEVRQAIDYAIDKDSVINSVLGGAGQEGVWSLPWELGYDPSLKPAYDYDLAKAQELMAAAGYADGFTLPITYLVTEWGATLADYLASALQAINITVELTALSGMPEFMPAIAAIHNAYVNGEDLPPTAVFMYDPGWPGNPEVMIDLTNGFYMGKDNTLFDNAEIDALVEQGLKTLDNDARAEIARQAWTLINDLLPAVPICLEVQVSFMKSNITYTKSVGGMNAGPLNLIDLTIS